MSLFRKMSLILSIFAITISAQSVSQEKIKAIFLEKFALFSEWPDSIKEDTLFILALWGDSKVTEEIREVYAKRFMGKSIKILELGEVDSIPKCHLLFIAEKDKEQLAHLLNQIEERPILTVSDQRGFGKAGVIINMYLERNQVRFEINKEALQKSSLAISYKLMQMAKVLEGP